MCLVLNEEMPTATDALVLKHAQEPQQTTLLDLFCGAAGLTTGLVEEISEQASVVWGVEKSLSPALSALCSHPTAKIYHMGVHDFKQKIKLFLGAHPVLVPAGLHAHICLYRPFGYLPVGCMCLLHCS